MKTHKFVVSKVGVVIRCTIETPWPTLIISIQSQNHPKDLFGLTNPTFTFLPQTPLLRFLHQISTLSSHNTNI